MKDITLTQPIQRDPITTVTPAFIGIDVLSGVVNLSFKDDVIPQTRIFEGATYDKFVAPLVETLLSQRVDTVVSQKVPAAFENKAAADAAQVAS